MGTGNFGTVSPVTISLEKANHPNQTRMTLPVKTNSPLISERKIEKPEKRKAATIASTVQNFQVTDKAATHPAASKATANHLTNFMNSGRKLIFIVSLSFVRSYGNRNSERKRISYFSQKVNTTSQVFLKTHHLKPERKGTTNFP